MNRATKAWLKQRQHLTSDGELEFAEIELRKLGVGIDSVNPIQRLGSVIIKKLYQKQGYTVKSGAYVNGMPVSLYATKGSEIRYIEVYAKPWTSNSQLPQYLESHHHQNSRLDLVLVAAAEREYTALSRKYPKFRVIKASEMRSQACEIL
jgi:hypothetical protein